ncbi:hypothetical protein Glove_547g37 [Diversispora epigaea]|uniref:Uncharacterized protein n=1 Tax=Diversispora epigaea TaxID=1348612 RepID=A0A397GC52_9GLOM|nr:hypothetical protein Glove_547g37 [Diversispora epigaea]
MTIVKAVETKLSNNYNGIAAQQQFSFIDPSFKPTLNKDKINFCSKELRLLIWELMKKHLHQHSLIPIEN